jgi:hypothetical protein
MKDGLYRVTTPYLCAGFVVEGGRVTLCAPILHKRIEYWQTQGKYVLPKLELPPYEQAQISSRYSDS